VRKESSQVRKMYKGRTKYKEEENNNENKRRSILE
jgi:hypothetical protein